MRLACSLFDHWNHWIERGRYQFLFCPAFQTGVCPLCEYCSTAPRCSKMFQMFQGHVPPTIHNPPLCTCRELSSQAHFAEVWTKSPGTLLLCSGDIGVCSAGGMQMRGADNLLCFECGTLEIRNYLDQASIQHEMSYVLHGLALCFSEMFGRASTAYCVRKTFAECQVRQVKSETGEIAWRQIRVSRLKMQLILSILVI